MYFVFTRDIIFLPKGSLATSLDQPGGGAGRNGCTFKKREDNEIEKDKDKGYLAASLNQPVVAQVRAQCSET